MPPTLMRKLALLAFATLGLVGLAAASFEVESADDD